MSEQDTFIAADEALNRVVQQVRDDQWAIKLPEWFQTGAQKEADLRAIINYHAHEDAWIPDMLAGKTIAEVGTAYDGDLLGEHPKVNFSVMMEQAVASVRALDEVDLDRPIHFSYGDYPIREGIKHLIYFRGIRAIDIAKVIGADSKLPHDLVQALWDMLAPEAEQWRQMGVFGPEVAVAENADLQSKLLGLTGRQP